MSSYFGEGYTVHGASGSDYFPPAPAASPYVGPGAAGGWVSDTAVPYSNQGAGESASNDGGGGGWLDSLASIFKSTAIGVSSVASTVHQGQQQYPGGYYPARPQQSAMPGWVIPAAVGVGVIGILVIMKSSRRSRVAGYRRRKAKK